MVLLRNPKVMKPLTLCMLDFVILLIGMETSVLKISACNKLNLFRFLMVFGFERLHLGIFKNKLHLLYFLRP